MSVETTNNNQLSMQELEILHLVTVLNSVDTIAAAVKILKLDNSTVYRKCKRFKIRKVAGVWGVHAAGAQGATMRQLYPPLGAMWTHRVPVVGWAACSIDTLNRLETDSIAVRLPGAAADRMVTIADMYDFREYDLEFQNIVHALSNSGCKYFIVSRLGAEPAKSE